MSLDLIVLTGALFHNHDGSVSRELADLRRANATNGAIAARFMELYPECRSIPTGGGTDKLPNNISPEDE